MLAGPIGPWQIVSTTTVIGLPWPSADRLRVTNTPNETHQAPPWSLRGITSNERYVQRHEKTLLQATQAPLGRPTSTRAALIPIRKTSAWWDLPQDERRQIFEAQSQHIQIGLQALPAVARRLYHCRDLSDHEPFDFLTWFEYAEQDTPIFEQLLHALRNSAEWSFVEREIDIRLCYDPL
jgi:chlorite dismutase